MFARLIVMQVKDAKEAEAHHILSQMTQSMQRQKGYVMTLMLHSVGDTADRGAVVLWQSKEDADAAMNTKASLAAMYELFPLLNGPLGGGLYEIHSDKKEILGA